MGISKHGITTEKNILHQKLKTILFCTYNDWKYNYIIYYIGNLYTEPFFTFFEFFFFSKKKYSKSLVIISGKLKSFVWNFYLPPGRNDKFATCKICHQEKSTGNIDPNKRTLFNLKRHIKTKHKAEWDYLNMQLEPHRKFEKIDIDNC